MSMDRRQFIKCLALAPLATMTKPVKATECEHDWQNCDYGRFKQCTKCKAVVHAKGRFNLKGEDVDGLTTGHILEVRDEMNARNIPFYEDKIGCRGKTNPAFSSKPEFGVWDGVRFIS